MELRRGIYGILLKENPGRGAVQEAAVYGMKSFAELRANGPYQVKPSEPHEVRILQLQG